MHYVNRGAVVLHGGVDGSLARAPTRRRLRARVLSGWTELNFNTLRCAAQKALLLCVRAKVKLAHYVDCAALSSKVY